MKRNHSFLVRCVHSVVTGVLIGIMASPDRQLLAQAAPSPVVLYRVINDGSPQRSTVTNLSAIFNTGVSITPSNLLLRRLGDITSINPTNFALTYDSVSNKATWTFPGLPARSLPDGNYAAAILANTVSNAAGVRLDGNADGRAGDPFVFDLFRYFGDWNGDRDIDFWDNYWFQRAWGMGATPPGGAGPELRALFDANGDSVLDTNDLARFQTNYFTILSPQPSALAALVHDTGLSAWDGYTADARIAGALMLTGLVRRFESRLDQTNNNSAFVETTGDLRTAFSFWFESSRLDQILGRPLEDGPHVYTARTISTNGGSSDYDLRFVLDRGAPNTSITSHPAHPTNDTRAMFGFTGTDALTPVDQLRYQCRLLATNAVPPNRPLAEWDSCASPMTFSNLLEGWHTFEVRAVDLADNFDPTPATFTWFVDLTPPETFLRRVPPRLTNSPVAVFNVTNNEPGTVQCRANGGAWNLCDFESVIGNLPEGTNTVEFRTVDLVGNIGPVVGYTWVIDLTPPDVPATCPPSPSLVTTETFEFFGTDNFTAPSNLVFECRHLNPRSDPAATNWTLCVSPQILVNLPDGTNVFEVRAIDEAGNVDPTPARCEWIVAAPPDTFIVEAPPVLTRQTAALFRFTGEDNSTASSNLVFEFRLAVAGLPMPVLLFDWTNAPGPQTNFVLTSGTYHFEVRAIDEAGNIDPTPAIHTWTIDATPPPLTLALHPDFDTPPVGDRTTTLTNVTLNGLTESNLTVTLTNLTPGAVGNLGNGVFLGSTGSDRDGNYYFPNVTLLRGTNLFVARSVDALGNENIAYLTVTNIVLCSFVDLTAWHTNIAAPLAGGLPGRVEFNRDDCFIELVEGDSFRVAAERTIQVQEGGQVLVITYATPGFDRTATQLMRDAFEIALVDATGRPLTYTIQGSNSVTPAGVELPTQLPPSPDACFNHTEGQTPFNAPGTAWTAPAPGLGQLAIDVRHLSPGSLARLILRLVNNDRDRATSVSITDLGFKPFEPMLNLGGSPGTAFSMIVGTGSTSNPPGTGTNTPCPPLPVMPALGPKIVFGRPTTNILNEVVSATLITNSNDPRVWQGASIGTFATLYFGEDSPATRDLVVDRQLLDAGLFNLSNTFPASLLPTPWTANTIYRGRSFDQTGTGDYGYEEVSTDVFTAANSIDNLWFQSSGTVGDTVFDLGAPSVKAAVFPTIDHGPLPQEAIESTIYLSLDRVTWAPAVVQRVWLEGWHPIFGVQWDGFVYAVGTASNTPFRFASTIWGGPGALLPLFGVDDEINGIVGLNEDFTPVQRIIPGSPTLAITSPLDNSRLAPGSVLLTGYALADHPDIFGIPATNSVLLVTVNGTPVDALDAAGNFFGAIGVRPGQNIFEVVATDAFNQSTTNSVTLYGETCPQNLSSLSEVSTSVVPEYGRTSFNEWTKVLYVDVALRNAGTYPIHAPLYVGVTRITDATVKLLAPDGVSADGIPYYDFSSTLTNSSLPTLHSSLSRALAFHNPNKVQFSYDLVVLGRLNQAPYFTTAPPLEIATNRVYTYDSEARDPDGDVLRYALLEFPRGMEIDSASGLIRWTATNAVGTYRIRLQADDQRGGLAEQSYLLSVTTPPSNRPPYFISTPVTVAKVSTNSFTDSQVVDLSRWSVIQYEFNVQPHANWDLSASNTVALQTVNADASILLSDFDLANDRIQGTWSVRTTADDDFMGFVFGFQDTNHFYLFDWKQLDQDDGHSGFAQRGMSVKRVTADSALLEPDIWATVAADTNRVRLLYHNTISYADFTEYEFTLDFRPGEFTIIIKQGTNVVADINLADSTYASGRFGFYNDSQEQVRYTGFTRRTLPEPTYAYDADAIDPDSDPLTYSLIVAPTNMTIHPITGLIRWGPTAADVGMHDVTVLVQDGRGGSNTQSYVICVLPDQAPVFVPQVLDLTLSEVDKGGVTFDRQALTAGGVASVTVSNRGPGDVRVPFDVTFFEDRNTNGVLDPTVDTILGKSTVATGLLANRDLLISTPVSSVVQFAGIPVWAFVDSGENVVESREDNNIARDACEAAPQVGQFDPVIEWQKSTFSELPNSRQVMNTPAIVDLDGDGIPEIIFGSTPSLGGGFVEVGNLRALRGDNGSEVFTVDAPSNQVNTASSVAVGDIDSDGRPEILACDDSGARIIAFENDKAFKWRSPTLEPINWGAPSIADLNHDGDPEIVIGRQVLNGTDGSIRWTGTAGRGANGNGPLSFAADIDLGGDLEVIAGNTIYTSTGAILYQNTSLPDGLVAIGNFDADPYPEIVLVAGGQVWLLEHTLEVKWGPVAIPGGGSGGPPTVADFDGDGQPEIGVAGASRYVVIETDGTIKWAAITQDGSSNVTGSSIFDFDGDGAAEVVYRDELFLRIYRGLDGHVLYQIPMSSCTWHEYVQVADVDGDGNAEIVAVANQNCGFGSQNGIYVIGDRNDTWVSTRRIWNQHAYHIDNINDDGSIPRHESNSWLTHNTFRLNALPTRSGTLAAPDLLPSLARVGESDANLVVTVRIGNGGVALVAPGLETAFYSGTPGQGGVFLGRALTTTRLLPGTFEDITFVTPIATATNLWVVADDDGTGRGKVSECNETNNFYRIDLPLPTVNHMPQFTSTPATNATEGQTYRYDVDAIDPDLGDVITYSLTFAPTGMGIDGSNGMITWSVTEDQNGQQAVVVAAEDSRGARSYQLFVVRVQDVLNASPRFVSHPPTNTFAAQLLTYLPSARDAEGDLLRFDLVSAPAGMILDTNANAVLWRPLLGQLGPHDVILRVQDGRGGVALQSWQIIVIAPNSPPVITTFPPRPAVVGLPWQYLLRAQDAEGGVLTFSLGDGAPIGPTLSNLATVALGSPSPLNGERAGVRGESVQSALLSWTPAVTNVGSNPIEIVVRDETGAKARQAFVLEVKAPGEPNRPPQIVSAPRRQARIGASYVYVAQASDADGDPLSFALVTGPAGMALTNDQAFGGVVPGGSGSAFNSQVILWTPSSSQFGSNFVQLRVTDGRGGAAEQGYGIVVASTLENRGPVIVSVPSLHATAGQPYEYDLAGTDPDGDLLTWRLVAAPIGVSLDPSTGALRWTASLDQLGTNTLTVEVQDSLLTTATQTWQIDVGCVNRPPQITSIPPTQANVDELYLYALRAEDPDGDPVTFSFTDTNAFPIPRGMTLSNLTTLALGSPSPLNGERGGARGEAVSGALIRWTPTTNDAPRSFTLRIRAIDGRGGSGEQIFTLHAINARANRSPAIVSTPPRGATVGRPYSYLVTATDPDGDLLTLTNLLPFPTGASLVPQPGLANSALLSWTPTGAQLGAHEFILAARDPSQASGAQRFTVTVRENLPPTITSVPRTNAIPGVNYHYDVFAFDPEGDALVYALAAPVPSGLGVDSLGRISWTPSLAQTGSFPVTVTASDSFGGSTHQSFAITVAADNEQPQVALALLQGLINPANGQWAGDLGTTLRVRVDTSDNVGVVSRALYLGADPIPLDAAFTGTILVERTGLFTLTGVATDLAGNTNATTRPILFRDPRATSTVFVRIHTPTNGAVITRPVPIRATLTNTTDLVSFSWGYALVSDIDPSGVSITDPAFTVIGVTNVPPGTRVLNDVLVGTFDPTLLNNDSYVLAVAGTDANGSTWTEPVVVNVQGNLKFGEFRLEFTDLAIPVAGIPIQITRVYDSRNARRSGDFGHGWSLGVHDAIIRESISPDGYLRPNARVYLNGPDGRRLGFTFTPDPFGGFIAGVMWRPRFTADPGVFERLEVAPGDIAYPEGGGFAGLIAALSGPYDPSTYFLSTRDGTRYQYDERSGLQLVTDLNGNRLEYTGSGIFHYPAGSTAPDQSVRFVRDTRGRITQIIDPNGNALHYAYDSAGDLASFTDLASNMTRYRYDTRPAHFLTNIIDFLGRDALRAEFDASGRLVAIYDAQGNPLRQAFDVDSRTATFNDGNGNTIVSAFDPNGNETVRGIVGVTTNYFAYDANNNLLASTNGRGFATNYTYDARGNVTSIRDSLGNRTTIAYNAQNKPVGVTNALGQILNLRYDTAGRLLEVVNNAGFTTSVTRDAQGRVVGLTDATGTNTTTFDYSNGCACGRPGKVTNPDGSFRLYEYTSQGLTNRVVNELGAEMLFHHDDSGKLLWMRDPLTNFTQFFYNGPLLTNVVDALDRSTRYEYDSLNRTNRIIDAEGGVVEFRYDNNGNRTHVIDPVGNVTRFIYDAANRLTQQIDPLGHTNFFAYDAAGNRSEAINRNGRKRTFAYDAANRMTNELWWEGGSIVRSIAFGFNELGVQVLAEDPAARYEYSYDALNRLERVLAQSAGVPDFTLLYTYTALGQVASVTDHWGVRVDSGYDNRNRLASRTWSSTLPGAGVDPARVDFAYHAAGNRIRTERFAGLAGTNRIGFTTNAYNRAGIVTNITHAGPTGTVLAKYDYNFDAAYQITRWAIGNQLSDFAYDRTGQLTNALNTAQPSENFRFDANGNRVGAQSSGQYVVGGNNQILSDGTNHYAYDAEGNMTSRSNTVTGVLTAYQWDHRNRLLSVLDCSPGGAVTQTVAFVYDVMNRRLSKAVNGPQNTNVVRFLYNQDDSWADLDGANAVTARYLHGARIDELLARQRASDGRGWYLTDHLGTVRDIANATGAVVAHVDYSSFGQVLGVSNPAAVDRFLFTGRELDRETGLYYYRARLYSALLGRFVSDDPIGFSALDHNLFRYVHNNPMHWIDPTGTTITGYSVALIALKGLIAGVVVGVLTTRIDCPGVNQEGDRLASLIVGGSTGGVIGLVAGGLFGVAALALGIPFGLGSAIIGSGPAAIGTGRAVGIIGATVFGIANSLGIRYTGLDDAVCQVLAKASPYAESR